MTLWNLLFYFDIFGLVSMLGMLIWNIRSRKKREREEREEPMHPFVVGDMVMLGDINPYKGDLKCEQPYEVLNIYSSTHIQLRADNDTYGWFLARCFQPYTGLGRPMPGDGYREYEEAIAAQEAMDEITSR